jgi:hypothetical protein
MSGIAPTEQELIARALESRLGDVYTAGPGIVQAYDPATQTADVLPAVKRPLPTADGDTVYEDLPIVPNVKVCFPSGGAFQVTWTISPGDSVLLVCCNFAIGQWRTGDNSQTVPPGDLRLHHLGSAFALPFLAIDSKAVPNAQASQNAFIIAGPLVVLGDQGATDFAALASKVDANFKAITDALGGCTPSPPSGPDAGEPGLLSVKTALSSALPSVACSKVKIK